MDATFFSNIMTWFHPVVEVPEEEPRHVRVSEHRRSKVVELREHLKTDPSLNEKINDITTQLLQGVGHQHERR